MANCWQSTEGTSRRWKGSAARREVVRAASFLLLASACVAPPVLADEGESKLDFTFYRKGDEDTWLRPSTRIDQAIFTTRKAYGGKTRRNLGNDADGWYELGIVPALDTQISLDDYGTLRGRISAVWTTTQLGTDAAGSTLSPDGHMRYPNELNLEDFYVGWNSGKLFADSLGEGAIDLSVGAQQYIAGPTGPDGDGYGGGFLFFNGGSDGGSRGGYWLGLRNAFQMTGIAKVRTGAFDGEWVFLRSSELGNLDTEITGTNLGYDFGEMLGLPFARVRAAYYRGLDADDRRRDGLNVFLTSLDVKPLPFATGLRFIGEYVYERNHSKNDSWAAWGELGYEFEDASWKPYVSYRIAYFSGDNGKGRNKNFDPLFWGFSDWNYWFLGEISGEYLTQNANLEAFILRLRSSPLDSLTFNFFWIYQRLDNKLDGTLTPRPPAGPKAATIRDQDLSHELDFIVDWSPSDHLMFSFVAAYLFPLSGGKDYFGGNATWQNYMLWTSLRF